MPSFGNNIKAIKSIFRLSSHIKRSLSKLKKKRNIKRKKHVENLIASKTRAKINDENDAMKNFLIQKLELKLTMKMML